MFTLPYVLATVLAVGGSIQQIELDKLVAASGQLKQGDDEPRVLEVLGEPSRRCPHGLSLFTRLEAPPQWIYGTSIDVTDIINSDSTLPNLLPIKLRIFSPDRGDLVINWDHDGRIASVQAPARVGTE